MRRGREGRRGERKEKKSEFLQKDPCMVKIEFVKFINTLQCFFFLTIYLKFKYECLSATKDKVTGFFFFLH